ncbi:VCBS repeat-containing protein [Fodinibius sp.]|uniref:FG-GAP repeat domain-containing protein n=1 Tax=Fodinibius sp. TaxID=1872440 RepID=UPI002ACE03CC|nr:VCBS repeat-containing protein [Fodinibius sp.]MDZ7658503.1 VCBS repeat-containing protein [Fodinibius sp.]
MRYPIILLFVTGLLVSACGWNLNAPDDDNGGSDPGDGTPYFNNVSSTNLPGNRNFQTNTAKAVDINNDGNLDLVLAIGLQSNKILINDGDGLFGDQTSDRLTTQNLNSQDIAIADFNIDGNLDLFFPSEQNQSSELAINNGSGTFSDLSNRIPVAGNFTSATSLDFNNDGSMDLFIGNRGQNILLENSGNAFFNNQTSQRLPQILDATFDIAVGDITGNNLPDLLATNEGPNIVLINTGSGFFSNQSANRIPYINAIEESQDITLADIDRDGDLDIYYGNTGFQENANPQDRLLINDGQGFFSDQTSDRLPTISTNTFDAEFADFDNNGDLDLIIGNYNGGLRILINNGSGYFSDQSTNWLPENFTPPVMDIEVADFNGDNLLDIYVAARNGQDQLLLQKDRN